MGVERAVRDVGYALRVVNTMEGDSAGVAVAVVSLLEQGVDGIVISEPIGEGEVYVRVDVPVLFLGAPPAFAAPEWWPPGSAPTCWRERPPSTSWSATSR